MRSAPAHLIADLREHAFAAAEGQRRVGAEVELIAVDAETRRPAPIEARAGSTERATLDVLRAHGQGEGWREERSAKSGVPEFCTPDGGRITFEPGGQIEFSAAPVRSLTRLGKTLGTVVPALRAALADAGIDTLTMGLDPVNRVEDVAMQLPGDRYARMARHYASIGTEGARMMRQTASIQVCIDSGTEPLDRWRLLNALSPYVVAIFANSPIYDGETTGYQSTRRRIWGALDPARTGAFADGGGGGDAIRRYADFACGAAAILLGDNHPPFASFGEWAERGVTLDTWHEHLTTLFPEVRPRGYFEVRSCDALPPEWYVAPLTFIAGLAYGPDGGRTALEIAGPPDAEALDRAGRCGLYDPALADRAAQLYSLALRECASLGDAFVNDETLDRAREYFDRFTRLRRSPASELLASVGA
ncbi:MAG: glutamate-cysteine ligase family protein [Gemmatimonadaceae bacterium]